MLAYHRNQGGEKDDVGPLNENMTRLVAAGFKPFVTVIGEGGHAAELLAMGCEVAYANDDWRFAPAYDSGDPAGDAAARWEMIKNMWPPELSKDAWGVALNEPDKERARYVFRFILELAKLANADGYRVCGPNWSTGTPEVAEWETPEGLAWLGYCGDHPDIAACAVHEYSLDTANIRTAYPWLIGRHQFVDFLCDEYDIPRPRWLVCEMGWSYESMPDTPTALAQLTQPDGDEPAIVDLYDDAALWTLGGWKNGPNLPPKLAQLIAPLTDWILANREPPDPPDEPDLGLWYKSIVVLAPQDYTLEQMLELRRRNYENRRTITQSHDEALQLRQLGAEGSYTIVYDIERWEAEIQRQLVAGLHQLEVLSPPEFGFAAWPTEYKVVTQLFGANPQNYDEFGLPGHDGVDVRAYMGTAIFAVAPGTVTWAGDGNGAYGIYVVVDHGGGWTTAYAHCQSVMVSAGQQVVAGQQIARADNTGNSDGSHLHLSLKRAGHTYVDENGVAWPRNYHDPTELLAVFNPQWPGAPPAPTIDTLPYLMGDGRLYEVRNAAGGQERFQTQRDGNIFYQTKNSQWEMLIFDDNHIYRDVDTSPGGGRYYRLLEFGTPGSRWIPRHWRPGEKFTQARRVQFYEKATCERVDENSGDVTDTMQFVARHATYKFRTGIELPDVVELLWVNGGERYFYARNFGLVGWERQHFDPNTPAWSAISELHAAGARPDNQREVIGCL